MKNFILLLSISSIFFSCKKIEPCVPVSDTSIETLNYSISSTSSKAEDDASLSELFTKIKFLAESYSCTNENEWKFTAYGTKACGGPIAYIAYSKCINTTDFLNKIKVYTELQSEYNSKHGMVSTCDVPPPPSSITCEYGAAVLVY